jgi:hypothetical protein
MGGIVVGAVVGRGVVGRGVVGRGVVGRGVVGPGGVTVTVGRGGTPVGRGMLIVGRGPVGFGPPCSWPPPPPGGRRPVQPAISATAAMAIGTAIRRARCEGDFIMVLPLGYVLHVCFDPDGETNARS